MMRMNDRTNLMEFNRSVPIFATTRILHDGIHVRGIKDALRKATTIE